MDILIFLLFFSAIIYFKSIKIVKDSEVFIIERLGKYHHTALPGINFIVPFIDNVRAIINMRQQTINIPPQGVITNDNITITVDSAVSYQIIDAVKAIYEVESLQRGIQYIVITTIRDIIGKMNFDEALNSRQLINSKLYDILYKACDKWGCKIECVEIKNISEPNDTIKSFSENFDIHSFMDEHLKNIDPSVKKRIEDSYISLQNDLKNDDLTNNDLKDNSDNPIKYY